MEQYKWEMLKEKLIDILLDVVRVILVLLALFLFFPLGIYLIWVFFIKRPPKKGPDPYYPEAEDPEEIKAREEKSRKAHDDFLKEYYFRHAKDWFNYGVCTVVEREKGKELLRQAKEKGNYEASMFLRSIEQAERDVAELKQKAHDGSGEAAYKLGKLCMTGDMGISPSMEQAMYWFRLSAKAGHREGEKMVSRYAGWEKDYDAAMYMRRTYNLRQTDWETKSTLLRLAEAGYPPAIAQQGIMHYNLERTTLGENQAYEMFSRGARLGNHFCVQACIYLSRLRSLAAHELWIEYAKYLGVPVLTEEEFRERYIVEV